MDANPLNALAEILIADVIDVARKLHTEAATAAAITVLGVRECARGLLSSAAQEGARLTGVPVDMLAAAMDAALDNAL